MEKQKSLRVINKVSGHVDLCLEDVWPIRFVLLTEYYMLEIVVRVKDTKIKRQKI